MADVLRIPPFCYVHVADNNSNVTRVEVGPKTFVRQDHEKVVYGPAKMITIPPRQYCVIANPHVRDEQGNAVKDQFGQIKVRHGDKEVRLTQDPFPLYVGEELVDRVRPLEVLPADTALRLRAIRDFDERVAGDEWLYEGPGTYIPRVEVEVVERVVASLIKTNQALRLRARRATTDRKGATRRAGEEWIVSDEGAYLPGVDEEVVEVVSAETLTETTALHIRALRTFKDVFDKERKAGEEWLVTLSDCETYIIGVYEELIGRTEIITLSSRQYCVVLNPVGSNGKPQLGKRELRKGERSFFLLPGEMLERGIQDVYVLADDEALLLRASETFEDPYGPDDKKTVRQPGDRWMVHGPRDYVPPVEVEVLEKRSCIPLDENEGIYVRDTHTGRIRAVVGESYLLKSNEELYNKELPETVEQLLGRDTDPLSGRGDRRMSTKGPRDPTRVVTFRAPHNAAVQVYDFKEKKSRIVFGPELVMLSPDEHFTVLSLSGGKPKRPHVIKAIALLLGPDFMTDVVTVETSDHARLQLQLSYNWHFDIEGAREEGDPGKIFQVPDFVGDACKAIASRVRGAVAAVPFDKFHKSSSRIIRASLFGIDAEGKVRDSFRFASNNLVITSIDIQSVEPVDQKTRDSLQKSVQLAIEITTKSQEATARHEADLKSQEARGKLERQRINDEAEAEKARRDLLELQAHSAAVESTGHATAEAKARAEAAQIEGEAAVRQAELHAKAARIEAEAELEKLKARQEQEIFYEDQRTKMEIERARKLAEIEAEKFAATVNAIGAETIKSIAQAGPEMQAKLLQGLGLKGYMITSGDNPINLFQTASGLVAGGGQLPGEGRGAGAAYTVSDDADSVA